MIDADHRRLTVWLVLGMTPLVALVGALALGWGRDAPLPQTGQPPPSVPVADVALPVDAVPRDAYVATWQVPVFSRDRQPDRRDRPVVATQMAGLDGLVLTGVIVTPSLQVALLKDARGRSFSLLRGDRLPSGWTLDTVEAGHADFSAGERRQRLPLARARAPLGTVDKRAPLSPPPSVAPPRRSTLAGHD